MLGRKAWIVNTPNGRKKRFPRFSIRTLVIVVTLVCCYTACWGPTKRHGESDVWEHVNARELIPRDTIARIRYDVSSCSVGFNEAATLPLVVRIGYCGFASLNSRRHYFWFFGYVAKLPYEREQ